MDGESGCLFATDAQYRLFYHSHNNLMNVFSKQNNELVDYPAKHPNSMQKN